MSLTSQEKAATDHLEHHQQLEDENDSTQTVGLKTWLQVFGIYVSFVATVFGLVVPSVTFGAASAVIGGADKQSWANTCSIAVLATLGTTIGLATDQFGRKYILVGLLCLGFAGSIVAATANGVAQLLSGIVLGAFGLSSLVISTAIPSEIVPHRYRPFVQGPLQFISGLAGVISFLASAALTKRFPLSGWRAMYYITAASYAVGTIAVIFLYNPPPQGHLKASTWSGRFLAIDPIGSLCWAGFIIPLVAALNFGNNPYPWVSVNVLLPMMIGFLFLGLFVLWEWKGTKTGLMHHDLFIGRGRNFPVALTCQFVEGFIFISFISFYPFETAVLWESDAIIGAVRNSIPQLTVMPFGLITGFYASKFRRIKDTLYVGYGLFMAGIVGLAACGVNSSVGAIICAILVGIGQNGPVIQLVVLVQLATPAWLIGTASAIDLSIRAVGAIIGGAAAGAVLNSKLAANIPSEIATAAMSYGVQPTDLPGIIGATSHFNATALAELGAAAGVPAATLGPFVGSCFAALKGAYANSFRYVWITEIPFLVLAIVSIYFIVEVTDQLNNQIDAPVQETTEAAGQQDSLERRE